MLLAAGPCSATCAARRWTTAPSWRALPAALRTTDLAGRCATRVPASRPRTGGPRAAAVLAWRIAAASWQSRRSATRTARRQGPAEGRVTAHRDDYARDATRGHCLRTGAGHDSLARPHGAADQLRHVRRRRRAGASRASRRPARRRTAGSLDVPRDARPRAPRRAARGGHRRAPGCDPSPRPSSAGARHASCSTPVAPEHGAAVPDLAGIAGTLASARAGRVAGRRHDGRTTRSESARAPRGARGQAARAAIESLTKHAQLGLDRVTAARIYAPHGEAHNARRAARASRCQHRGCVGARPSHPGSRRARSAAGTPRAQCRRARPETRGRGPGRRRSSPHPALVAHPGHGRLPADVADTAARHSRARPAFVDAALACARRGASRSSREPASGSTRRASTRRRRVRAECCGFVRISAGIEHARGTDSGRKACSVCALREA